MKYRKSASVSVFSIESVCVKVPHASFLSLSGLCVLVALMSLQNLSLKCLKVTLSETNCVSWQQLSQRLCTPSAAQRH